MQSLTSNLMSVSTPDYFESVKSTAISQNNVFEYASTSNAEIV